MENKVSIILPVFNGEKTIKKSIESILNQSYSNLELIIVNDCSVDNTLSIIQDYASKDKRVHIINNTINQKLPVSLNIGFRAATGNYLTWTSDDNAYHPTAIEIMVKILDTHSNIDLVYTDFYTVDLNGHIITEVRKEEPEFLKFRNVIGACFLYRQSLAVAAGEYDPSMFLAEDYEFFIRCYKHGNFFHLHDFLYDYGIHDSSLTATRNKEIRSQTYHAMNTHFDYLYFLCSTQSDKNQLLFSMLNLIDDPYKKKETLRRFCNLNHIFAVSYFLKHLKHR